LEFLFSITPEVFGPLWPMVEDPEITDIEYNGKHLWVTYASNEREKKNISLTRPFLDQLTQRVSNHVSLPLNKEHPVLEAEDGSVRISIIHESVAMTGRSLCIRKTLPGVRLTEEDAIKTGYMTPETLAFLKNCIRAHMSLVICGEPGAGKTELAKFLSRYIPDRERVITIEDTLEWHYSSIHPDADAVELKVSKKLPYADAIRSCLRQNPKWMMISEIRGEEAKDYVAALSTGVSGITTLHTDDARKVPERIVNMVSDRIGAERMENDIFTFLDFAIFLSRRPRHDGSLVRVVDQIAAFSMENRERVCRLVFDGGIKAESLPYETWAKFRREGIVDPFLEEGGIS